MKNTTKTNFCKKHIDMHIAVLFFLIRLLRRAIIHLFYARNKYSFVSIKMILLIIKSKFNSEKFMAKE